MNKLGPVQVGGANPIRIMGILNTSPESFYKKSVKRGRQIAWAVQEMEQDGADFVDVGGMSTAPYLSTMVSEKEETRRIVEAIKQIQRVSNLPISVDTCRANVAKEALELGVDIINDVSGLKYDKKMSQVLAKYEPSLVVCAYSPVQTRGDPVLQTKSLLRQSISIAKSAGISKDKIAIDPAIGFFRRSGKNPFYTKIRGDWLKRDLQVLQNLDSLKKLNLPILVSVSNKSFLGKILDKKNPADRIYGSIAAEVIAVLNGTNIIRTHNVKETKDAALVAQMFSKKSKKSL
ncbi:MAG TPA: dihydropteroate synthase [Candidatus Nitrosotenuis sp.]|nr:dihydropteroate synthase [Candidatus Nitrosotenuis sp.]